MKQYITILFLTFAGLSMAQKVTIEPFTFVVLNDEEETSSEDLNFPVVHTGKENIDALINTDMKNRFTSNEYSDEPLDSTLIKWAGEQIISLGYDVTYNSKGILSLNITAIGCGAYCSGWTAYYNYSTVNGKFLEISDVIELNEEFTSLVNQDKSRQYSVQKEELLKKRNDPTWALDQETYEFALEEYETCDGEMVFQSYLISPCGIELIDECHLPHVIESLAPEISLKYSKSTIKKFLKIKI